MPNRFRISHAVLRKLGELHISPNRVLACARLPSALLQQEKILLTTEELFAFYRAVAEVSRGDPTIGLRIGDEQRAERYDPIAIAALCTRTLRDAFQRMARYKQLTCPEKIELIENKDECAVRFEWLLAREQEPPVLIDVCFAWMMSVARRGTGAGMKPKRIELRRPLGIRHLYEGYFGCPIKFRAAQDLIVFRREDMDAPLQTHNPDLLAVVAPQLEAELREQQAAKTISEQAKSVLKRLLAGRPGLQEVAAELRLSTRTLQRRLKQEGVSFQQLVQQARHELARHYLLHSSLELNETAYLLGYEDANSFFRAFHSWEGTSPGEWRSSQATAL